MAIQFPNFLSVPVRTPDYSGLGDIVDNYYRGKAMPKDDLIKAIQAQFAQPTAEETLKGLKLGNTGKGLSNQKEQLDINRLIREAAEQKAFETQLTQALKNVGGSGAMGGNAGAIGAAPPMTGAAPTGSPQVINPALGQALAQGQQNGQTAMPAGATTNLQADGIDPTKMDPRYRKFDQQATGLPDNAYKPGAPLTAGSVPTSSTQPAVAPAVSMLPASQPEEPHEVVVTAGSPHLQGIDAMWENNPTSREFLKKRGYEKKQDIKFNAKTGQTTVITKYPSGTITQKTVGNVGSTPEGIPLTNKMVSQHQQMISAIDNAKPIINDIINQKGFQPYPRAMGMGLVPGWMGQAATYDTLVKSALDTLMKAYGLPSTNEGIGTVKDQLLIHHGETTGHYRDRLRSLIKDLDRRKDYSEREVKRSNKIQPVDSSASGQSYSSDEWEVANDQQ